MTRAGWLRCTLAISLVACSSDPSDPGGDGSGFRVTAVQPADGATGISLTETLDATLSAALDPASLVPGAVAVRREGVPIPAVIQYDGANRGIHIVAPLVPGETYQVELGSGLRSVGGVPLEPHAWTVTTREWQPVPLGDVGQLSYYGVALGPSGSIHLLGSGEDRPVSDYYDAYMKYAECASSCADPASWGRMAVDSAYLPFSRGAVAIGPAGEVHLLYIALESSGGDPLLRYGTCASSCLEEASWTRGTLADGDTWTLNGFAQDESGGLHMVTVMPGTVTPHLRYGTCTGGCQDSTAWTFTPIPVIGYAQDEARSLQVDRNGRIHLITAFAAQLSYSTCATDCLSSAQWSTGVLEGAGGNRRSGPSYYLDEAAVLHLVYTDVNGSLVYSRCTGSCTSPSAWQRVEVDEGEAWGTSLTVDGRGRITVLNTDTDPAQVRFLTCVADCLDSSSWQAAAVGPFEITVQGAYPDLRLALGPEGRLRMVGVGQDGVVEYLE